MCARALRTAFAQHDRHERHAERSLAAAHQEEPCRRPAHPPAPLPLGRVLACIALSILAALALVAWSPAHADDAEAREGREPLLPRQERRPVARRLPLKAHAGRREDRRRDRRRDASRSTTATRASAPIEAQVRVPRLDQCRGVRDERAPGRPPASPRRSARSSSARIEYDAAKREGKTTALLEQHRPNVFQMNVANILPGDDVAVELRYTELIAPRRRPLPLRVSRPSSARATTPAERVAGQRRSWVGHRRTCRAGVTLEHHASICQVQLRRAAAGRAKSRRATRTRSRSQGERHRARRRGARATSGVPANNRDFILDYRLGRRAHRHRPDAVPRAERTDARTSSSRWSSRRRRWRRCRSTRATTSSWSTSRARCTAIRCDTAKVLLRDLIGGLRPSDTFNVVLFSGSSRDAVADNRCRPRAPTSTRAIKTIEQMGGGGSTEIVPALRRVAALPKPADVSRSVIVVTDGYVTVENEVFELVRRNLEQRQRVRVRHRLVGEPPPDRRPGARRQGRGLHRHQARAARPSRPSACAA